MIDHPEEGPTRARQVLDQVMRDVPDDVEAVAEFQRRLVEPICEKFMPMFEASGREEGYVSIQGDPIREHDPQVIIAEAHANRKVAPNVCCKIPTTGSGLEAMETLIPEGTPINATEIFAMRQGLDLGELYERLVPQAQRGRCSSTRTSPASTTITWLPAYTEEHQVDIAPICLVQAGLAVSRKLYASSKNAGTACRSSAVARAGCTTSPSW